MSDIPGINVGDILRVRNGNKYRVWQVSGIYYGIEGQESLVHLKPLDINESSEGRIMVPVTIYELAQGLRGGQ